MRYEEALEIINRAIAPKKLNQLETMVCGLSLQDKTYCQIVQLLPEVPELNLCYSYSYLKDVGSDLCKLLSQAFGFKVTKLNLHSSVVRYAEENQICKTFASSQHTWVDWGEAPDTWQLSGRQAELETLNQWVMQDRCKVVAIAGNGGIGKTTVATQSAQQLADTDQFDIVVWRSLRQAPLLSDLLTELLSVMAAPAVLGIAPGQLTQTAPEAVIRQLLEQLRARRYLLIFDNVEAVFAPNELAGTYKPGYQDYGLLFKQLGEVQHQSCVLLTSREIPSELAHEEGANASVRLLRLESLSVEQGATILASKGLLPAKLSQTRELVNRYQGNPLALKIAATMIKELSDGDLTAFVTKETLLFTDIYKLLAQQFNRLSLNEQQVMYWLAINQEAVTAAELEAYLLPLVPRVELQEALVSLGRRSLIKKIKPPSANPTALMSLDSVSYTQQPLIMAFVKQKLLEQTCQEMEEVQTVYLKSHALLKAQARNCAKDVQIQTCEDTNISGLERIKVCTQ